MDRSIFVRHIAVLIGMLVVAGFGCPTDEPQTDEDTGGIVDARADGEGDKDTTSEPKDTGPEDGGGADASDVDEGDASDTGPVDASDGGDTISDAGDGGAIDTTDATDAWDLGSPDTWGDPNRWKQISAGGGFTCGIENADNSICCWGRGTSNEDELADPPGQFKQVASGSRYSCAVKTNGELVCWGERPLGEGAENEQDPPSGSNFTQVDVGITHACALKQNGEIECWGNSSNGKLDVPEGPNNQKTFLDLAVGRTFTCALNDIYRVDCWGEGGDGQISDVPPGQYRAVSVGNSHACALTFTGRDVDCWGREISGSTGGQSGDFNRLSSGNNFNCAINTSDQLNCWGDNSDGQTNAPPGRYSMVATGYDHTCAVETTRGLECWGGNIPNRDIEPKYPRPPRPSECSQ